jgi:hypothetical protein
VDWILLAHHTDQWHTVVKTAVNLLVSPKAGHFLSGYQFMKEMID